MRPAMDSLRCCARWGVVASNSNETREKPQRAWSRYWQWRTERVCAGTRLVGERGRIVRHAKYVIKNGERDPEDPMLWLRILRSIHRAAQ